MKLCTISDMLLLGFSSCFFLAIFYMYTLEDRLRFGLNEHSASYFY